MKQEVIMLNVLPKHDREIKSQLKTPLTLDGNDNVRKQIRKISKNPIYVSM